MKMDRNTFRSNCQCCNREIKGSENKYRVGFDVFPCKLYYGFFKHEKDYVLCKECYRAVKLFIKKGGIMT